MAWLILLVAGLLETTWTIGLKYSAGFTKLVPTLITASSVIASMWLLGIAARTLPIGTAYSVWVGIGALGATILGASLFNEPISPARGFFIALLVAAIIGLKLTAVDATAVTTPE
ncbi:MAG: multidrug efflux SMR transporter [Myxococcota bacterium]